MSLNDVSNDVMYYVIGKFLVCAEKYFLLMISKRFRQLFMLDCNHKHYRSRICFEDGSSIELCFYGIIVILSVYDGERENYRLIYYKGYYDEMYEFFLRDDLIKKSTEISNITGYKKISEQLSDILNIRSIYIQDKYYTYDATFGKYIHKVNDFHYVIFPENKVIKKENDTISIICNNDKILVICDSIKNIKSEYVFMKCVKKLCILNTTIRN